MFYYLYALNFSFVNSFFFRLEEKPSPFTPPLWRAAGVARPFSPKGFLLFLLFLIR